MPASAKGVLGKTRARAQTVAELNPHHTSRSCSYSSSHGELSPSEATVPGLSVPPCKALWAEGPTPSLWAEGLLSGAAQKGAGPLLPVERAGGWP